jgi:hypothetical protein
MVLNRVLSDLLSSNKDVRESGAKLLLYRVLMRVAVVDAVQESCYI